MSKHTPGPWKHVDGIVLTHDEKFICDCASSDLDPDTQDNNARLIAAAPELFEAAKTLVSFIDSQKPPFECAFPWLVGILRDAIKKAEGKV